MHERGDAGRKLLRELPTVDDMVVVVILEVEVVTADGLHVRIPHHVHHAHQFFAIARHLRDVGRAGVAEGEEVGFLVHERIPEHVAGDRDQPVPLLAEWFRGRGEGMATVCGGTGVNVRYGCAGRNGAMRTVTVVPSGTVPSSFDGTSGPV